LHCSWLKRATYGNVCVRGEECLAKPIWANFIKLPGPKSFFTETHRLIWICLLDNVSGFIFTLRHLESAAFILDGTKIFRLYCDVTLARESETSDH